MSKYEQRVRERAAELAKVFDPSLYNRLRASYGTNPVDALRNKENKKLRTQVTRLEEKMIPAARLAVKWGAEAYGKGCKVWNSDTDQPDPYIEQQLQSLGLVPEKNEE